MDDKIYDIDRNVERMGKDISRLVSDFERMEKRFDDIYRETGASQGRSLYQQIDEMEEKNKELDRKLTEIERDVQSIRKMTEYGDTRLKEIMKGLSLIYRATDDLESNLVEDENIETR